MQTTMSRWKFTGRLEMRFAILAMGLMPLLAGCATGGVPSAGEGSGAHGAKIAAVRASGHDDNLPENAIDGNPATRWSARGQGAWIDADLGSAQAVTAVKIAWYQGDARVNHFAIAGSQDGKSFSELFAGDSTGKTAEFEKYAFKPAVARWVRVTVNGNTRNKWNSISELAVEVTGQGAARNDAPGDAVLAAKKVKPAKVESAAAAVDAKPLPRAEKQPARDGIWISKAELAKLPASGAEWEHLKAAADGEHLQAKVSDQNSHHDTMTLAAALVYARTGDAAYRSKAAEAIASAIGTESGGRTLALGRNLVSYVIAADLIQLSTFDAAKEKQFRQWLGEVRSERLSGKTLISTHEERPNNWGTHAGASRVAVDLYLHDDADLERAAHVFRGWLGDRAAYDGFKYGDLAWQADGEHPVGINPAGAKKEGHSIDGVLADDQRRSGGGFSWPPAKENYAWEALQGAVVQAQLLARAGYDSWNWSDRALLRAVTWQYEVNEFPATGDDTWQIPLINHAYGSHFAVGAPSVGKNMGFTDWMYR